MNDMYYYLIEDKYINQYLVTIDIETLKKLRKEIIDNCSTIKHINRKTTIEPNYYCDEHIKNYKSKELGMRSYNDFYSQDEMEYLVDYDYYEFSILVNIIDELIKGNTKIIDELNNPNLLNMQDNQKNLDDIDLKIQIKALIDKGLYDKIDELVQNKTADLILKKQENHILEKNYLIKINQCIKLELFNQITIDDFNIIKEFFIDSDVKKNISTNLVKLLKRD